MAKAGPPRGGHSRGPGRKDNMRQKNKNGYSDKFHPRGGGSELQNQSSGNAGQKSLPSLDLPMRAVGKWYDFVPAASEGKLQGRKSKLNSLTSAEQLKSQARERLAAEISRFEKSSEKGKGASNNSDFLQKVMSSGTLADKMASMMLMIQESPMHRLNVLDLLLKMAGRKGKREAIMAIDTLKDLFLSDLLPDRKLKFLHEHITADMKELEERVTVFWFFEDAIKQRYAQFVEHLEGAMHDSLPHVKKKACRITFDLLRSKPEQEAGLLFLLVNKLGDPDKQIASLVSHLCARLLQEHPAMKSVVSAEVQRLLFRPNVPEKAKHYGTVFLNQIVLTRRDAALASELVAAYLSLFRQQMAERRKDLDNKTLTAILTGIHRALPFATAAAQDAAAAPAAGAAAGAQAPAKGGGAAAMLAEHIDNIFKMVYVATFNTAVQALQVLFQATSIGAGGGEDGAAGGGEGNSPSGRFYQALYAKLAAAELSTSSKHSLFLNLVYKACRADPVPARRRAFVKRLLQAAAAGPVPLACGALVLVSALGAEKPDLYDPPLPSPDPAEAAAAAAAGGAGAAEEGGVREGDTVEIHSLQKTPEFNGLTGRVEGRDGDRFTVEVPGQQELLRVRPANLRRVAGAEGEEGGDADGLRVGDVVAIHSLVKTAEFNGLTGRVEGRDGERYVVHVQGRDEALRVRPDNLRRVSAAAGGHGSGHEGGHGGAGGRMRAGDVVVLTGLESAQQLNGRVGTVKGEDGERFVVQVDGEDTLLRVKAANLVRQSGVWGYGYDATKRQPEYCGAEYAHVWELHGLTHHYHPTVRLFARQVLQRTKIEYPGDVLEDFQIINFLDKWVYKNPKQRPAAAKAAALDDEDGEGGGGAARGTRGGSVMQRIRPGAGRGDAVPVNSEEWLKTHAGSGEAGGPAVGAADEFFFRYFSQKAERERARKALRRKRSGREEEELAEADEAFAGGALSDEDDDASSAGGGDQEEEEGFGLEGEEEGEEEEEDSGEEGLIMGGDDDDSEVEMSSREGSEEEEEAVPTKKGRKGKEQLAAVGRKRKGAAAADSDEDHEEEDDSDDDEAADASDDSDEYDGEGGEGGEEEDDWSHGYSDMDDDGDDDDEEEAGGAAGGKSKSTREAEQEMIRELEAGLASDDSDVEFNTRMVSGRAAGRGGGGDSDSDDGDGAVTRKGAGARGGKAAGRRPAGEDAAPPRKKRRGGGGSDDEDDGEAAAGAGRRGGSSAFAAAEDYAEMLASDDEEGAASGRGGRAPGGKGRGPPNRGRPARGKAPARGGVAGGRGGKGRGGKGR